jgi:hypothetical protein
MRHTVDETVPIVPRPAGELKRCVQGGGGLARRYRLAILAGHFDSFDLASGVR